MGVYIHIPFCAKKCGYCDFYSIVNFDEYKSQILEAIKKDIKLRSDVLGTYKPKTIYFGGGTPSLYAPNELQSVIDTIKDVFNTETFDEITVELNPEDLTTEYIQNLRKYDFNRVSLGVQSFRDETLSLMNRRHNAERAKTAVKELQDNGFDNISIDLIYGVHNVSLENWIADLNTAVSLNVQHISAYHLSIEEGTPFDKLLQKGKIDIVDENISEDSYNEMIKTLTNAGFVHYEISNFAIDNEHVSKHNSSYWTGIPYLGVGPSAHSFDGKKCRTWCVSSVRDYVKGVKEGQNYTENEILTNNDLYFEFIMLSLRQLNGLCLDTLEKRFNEQYNTFLKNIKPFVDNGDMLITTDRKVKISEKSILIADYIISRTLKRG
ncbi:MAG: radical SAM family heme chaperone HemW [Rikenellaceae bacterium]